MNSPLNRLSVRNRIWALVVLLIGGIVLGGLISALTLRDEMWREKEEKTRQLVETGLSVLSHYHQMQVRGELSEAAAQQAAKDTIRAMRYDGAEYFWLTDLSLPFPRMVVHPTLPELDGQVLDSAQFNSAKGQLVGTEGPFVPIDGKKNLFATFVEVVNKGGKGYVTYDWPKPKVGAGVTEQRYPKLSYVEKFEPWGWLIGSGVYVDEVDAIVRSQIGYTLLFAAASGMVILLLASLLASSITRPLHQTVIAMRRIGQEDGAFAERLPVEGRGEIVELANGFNEMLEKIEVRDALLARQRNSLEVEVAARTIELRDTNIELQRELAEHHKAEQLVQESRIRMRALIDATNESVLLLDPEGRILAINAFGASRFGQSPEEINGKNFFALMPESLADKRRVLVQQVFTSGQPQHSQDRRGSVFFSNSLYPVKDASGTVESVAIFAKDVTEQHRTKEVDTIFSALDNVLLKWQTNLESIAQMFCEEILPVFDLMAAWVGRADKDGKLVMLASAEGDEKGMLSSLRSGSMRWKGDPSCCAFAGEVIQSGNWKIVMSDDPQCQSCSSRIASEQTRSVIILPVTLRGATWGALALYGRDAHHFDGEELPQRLATIATRLGYALESAMQQEWLTLMDTALAGVGNSVFVTDAKANILWVNRAFTELSGFSSEEILGKNPNVLSSGAQDAAFYQHFWQTIKAGTTWHGDVVNARRDGTRYTVSQTVTPLLNAEGQVSHYVAILEDITQRRIEEERIRHSANFDLLTDLPNRSLFFDRLGQAMAHGRRDGTPGALMFLDLDHFKEVNDQLGHAAGDSLLVAAAKRLREQVRESDTVARLGGDEFTVILPSLRDDTDAVRVADNIIEALRKPFEIAGTQVLIGVSIGIALFSKHGNTVERVLSAADHAMYLSKNAGRNRYSFATIEAASSKMKHESNQQS
ncbi:diguanylate cyclase [Rhodoferax sp. GW822-FHT02A01]|uniref:diguanylate cyclase domain-containing protein n=1 Tax=Rhodoferax sp. GW822-FHT02A01 TaxID=3141537 RepID=UPI00315D0603